MSSRHHGQRQQAAAVAGVGVAVAALIAAIPAARRRSVGRPVPSVASVNSSVRHRATRKTLERCPCPECKGQQVPVKLALAHRQQINAAAAAGGAAPSRGRGRPSAKRMRIDDDDDDEDRSFIDHGGDIQEQEEEDPPLHDGQKCKQIVYATSCMQMRVLSLSLSVCVSVCCLQFGMIRRSISWTHRIQMNPVGMSTMMRMRWRSIQLLHRLLRLHS